MKIFVKNKDIRKVVEELREYMQFKEIRVGFGYGNPARLITINDYMIEVFSFSEGSRGHKSDFIVYDDDITDREINELICPMGIVDRDMDVPPIFITYKQFLKLSKIFV